ncbi:MAG TPA: MFS transporter [Caulobacteraceae bacterium]|jgi:DHA2 family multidrug resistance protein-like MFS transporter
MPSDTEPDGLPTPRRYWAILAIGLALTLAVLDSAIANVALPTIARDLHASPAASIWVVNAYQLATVISLLPLAALGEIVGYRRVYQAGLALFVAASLGCALARSIDALAFARIVQGFGAAGIMSVNGALVRFTYPQDRLGQGIGINAMVVSISAAVGPTVASAILAVAPWPWLFGVNVPIGLAAIAVAAFALPRTMTTDRKFDWKSALLNAVAFGLLIFGVELWGRGAPLFGAGMVAAGLVAGVLLCLRELPRPAPLVPFDLLRVPIYGLSVATSICSFTAQMLAFVSLPFYFETVLGRSAVETGLLMTPWPVAVAVAAPIAGHLADRFAAGLLGGIGLAILAVGLGLLSALSPHAGVADIVWRMAICGLGFGIFQSPNNRAMMSAAPRRRSGAAGGMLATARLIGQTAGAAGVALIFRLQGHGATNLTLIVAAVVAAVAGCVSLTRLVGGGATPVPANPAPAEA